MRLQRCLVIFSFFLPFFIQAQQNGVTLSGVVKDKSSGTTLQYANVTLRHATDSNFAMATITNEMGRFNLTKISAGQYLLEVSSVGYIPQWQPVLAGNLSLFLDAGTILLQRDTTLLSEVVVTGLRPDDVGNRLDKKTFSITNNISQAGGSVLGAMKNLPGITVDGEGKVQLRGSDKVMVLIDGKQTALSGFGNQAALDNIPASAIDRIEIINNPSAKYDANGAAGVINIIYKQNKQEGWNGKIGFTTGLGALWQKKENLPGIRPQYQATPKINPTLSLNYRKKGINAFVQGDWLYNKTLNKNDFTERFYTNGDTIKNQVKRNRITTVGTVKAGIDWQLNSTNSVSVFGLFSSEYVRDNGDLPYFDSKLLNRSRLWQFYEDEVNSAATASLSYQHKFTQPGHLLNVGFNYTFHREDEKYFLTDNRPTYIGKDTFMLIADESVADVTIDYIRPLKHGRIESGAKFRRRGIPTNMQFFPGINSPLDTNAAGKAKYSETIPALYTNYIYETAKFELEAGLRLEYVKLNYNVNPDHNTYKSDGYSYTQPFPSLRLGYKWNEHNKLSIFYNRRVDRPDEVDIRIFPKYDDPEILKVGNPALQPQFTNTIEGGYKRGIGKGYIYAAIYYRTINKTITRIGTIVPNSTIIYSVFQNAGRSYNTGVEAIIQQTWSKIFSFNTNVTIYKNHINAFTVQNLYPVPTTFRSGSQEATSGNIKFNGFFHFGKATDVQLTAIYLAPDVIAQGKIYSRFSVDAGLKKAVQKGKGEMFLNASDVFNTLRIRKKISGEGFQFTSTDYYETQVFRIGYSYKF